MRSGVRVALLRIGSISNCDMATTGFRHRFGALPLHALLRRKTICKAILSTAERSVITGGLKQTQTRKQLLAYTQPHACFPLQCSDSRNRHTDFYIYVTTLVLRFMNSHTTLMPFPTLFCTSLPYSAM
jgi:hypothetical protein